jgi:hypothetical protein
VSHYILNAVPGDAAQRERVAELLRAGTWDVDAGERYSGELAAGDLVLVYLGAPAREFVGRAELASAVRPSGVALARVEEWSPPVPVEAVLAHLGPSAKADFEAGVVQITAHEYDTVLALAG